MLKCKKWPNQSKIFHWLIIFAIKPKVMTEDHNKIHDFAPYWEQREKNKKFLAQSKPPTIEQVKAQMERQKRERSNLN